MVLDRQVMYYVSYRKLFYLLNNWGLKPTYLYNFVSPPTLAKLRQNKVVSLDVIVRLCVALDVQPGDIMEVRSNIKFVEVREND